MGHGRVVTIDIENMHEIAHPRITFLVGDSVAVDIVAKVRSAVEDAGGPVMVILDSDHGDPHVARELEAYSRFVTDGSFLLCQDGVMDVLPALRQRPARAAARDPGIPGPSPGIRGGRGAERAVPDHASPDGMAAAPRARGQGGRLNTRIEPTSRPEVCRRADYRPASAQEEFIVPLLRACIEERWPGIRPRPPRGGTGGARHRLRPPAVPRPARGAGLFLRRPRHAAEPGRDRRRARRDRRGAPRRAGRRCPVRPAPLHRGHGARRGLGHGLPELRLPPGQGRDRRRDVPHVLPPARGALRLLEADAPRPGLLRAAGRPCAWSSGMGPATPGTSSAPCWAASAPKRPGPGSCPGPAPRAARAAWPLLLGLLRRRVLPRLIRLRGPVYLSNVVILERP